MRAKPIVVVVAVIALSGCGPDAEQGAEPAVGGEWRTLFDGSSLAGWTQVGDANWQLQDGAVAADSGIRCANPSEIGAATCYEVNIFDQRPDPTYRTGAIVEVAAPKVILETGDKWNRYEISARGRHLVVKLNGQTTVDTNDDKLAAGPFALQYGAGRVMFRNVRIRAN
jgi:hypothetical protein